LASVVAPKAKKRFEKSSHINVQALSELLEHVGRLISAVSFTSGLTPAQWNLLRYLFRANDTARTITSFAKFHATTKSSASQTARVLIGKELITVVPSDIDPRSKRLDLTPQGQEYLADDPLLRLGQALEAIAPEKLENFAEILTLLVKQVFQLAEGAPSPARPSHTRSLR
jgi:DNA-binding MarR family transcriptional regulator